MDSSNSLTYETARSLLCPTDSSVFVSAEQNHPWARIWTPAFRDLLRGSVLDQLWDSTLLRTFDANSGSYPLEGGSAMLARDSRMRLDEEHVRRQTLTTHSDHRIWENTPYISFTNSPQKLQKLANDRGMRRRGDQRIVVVDPRVRFELHLPILSYSEEIAHYEIKTRYTEDYWENHFLCLWEVTPEEVVGVWEWNCLRDNPNWYADHINPAVQRHRQERKQGTSKTPVYQRDIRVDADASDTSSDTENSGDCNDSDNSHEKVHEENSAVEVLTMYENLRLH